MSEQVEGAWPIDLLMHVGFRRRDALRLHRLLPPIEAGVVDTLPARSGMAWHRFPWDDPAAIVVWATRDVTVDQAVRLAHAGRGVVDVLVILAAVQEHWGCRVTSDGLDTSLDWASERTVPRNRLAHYIALGLSAAAAASLEADPSARPTLAALETLAALRRTAPLVTPVARTAFNNGSGHAVGPIRLPLRS